jgi:hypothetical protein
MSSEFAFSCRTKGIDVVLVDLLGKIGTATLFFDTRGARRGSDPGKARGGLTGQARRGRYSYDLNYDRLWIWRFEGGLGAGGAS